MNSFRIYMIEDSSNRIAMSLNDGLYSKEGLDLPVLKTELIGSQYLLVYNFKNTTLRFDGRFRDCSLNVGIFGEKNQIDNVKSELERIMNTELI